MVVARREPLHGDVGATSASLRSRYPALALHYREHAPPPDLATFVRCVWSLQAAADPHAPVEPIVPDGAVELIVHFGDRFARQRDGRLQLQPRGLFVGQITGPLAVAPTGNVGVIAARFRLGGAAPFLGGMPLHELTDRDIDLDDLWPGDGRRLVLAIGEARDERTRCAHLVAFLRQRLRFAHQHPAVAAADRWFARRGAVAAVDELARDLDLGSRQLQRLFADQVGLGPKRIARIVRFQELLASLRAAPRMPFAALAARCGYADQAHLVRDFREFTGLPPSQWLRRHTPMVALLSGFS
jgi:AraC-like DNA-binding protein